MLDKIISALESMQEDMEEHGELQKARGVSSAIWLIEIMRGWADRKTENSSEKPNNCDTCANGEGDVEACGYCRHGDLYEPKDEPQTDCPWK